MTARKPTPAYEVLICLAYSVVMHIALSRERTHARKFLPSLKLARRDEEHYLLGELLSQGNVTVFTQYDFHRTYLGSLRLDSAI